MKVWLLIPIPDIKRDIGERAVTVVVVEVAGVVGEVGLEDVEPAVAIIVADCHAHSGLVVPIVAVGASGEDGDIGEVPSWLLWNRILGSESTAT